MPPDFGRLHAAVSRHFSEPVEHVGPGSQPPLQVRGILNRYMVQARDMHDVPVSVPRTVLSVWKGDFADHDGPRQGARVRVRGTTYDVADVEPDGLGGAELVLAVVG